MLVNDRLRHKASDSLARAVRGAYRSVHHAADELGINERKLRAALDGELEKLTVKDLRTLGPLMTEPERDTLREWVIP